jgi:hypothetical protein
MEDGMEEMKNGKAEFIDKLQGEKIRRRRCKEIILKE